jgi:serine/threonine protein kinase
MEYCACSVSDMITACAQTMSEAQIAVICAAALQGLEYLHKAKNIHRVPFDFCRNLPVFQT